MEGTYPLPEAQLDRFFFKINVAYPTEGELIEIARRTTGNEMARPRPVADGPRVLAMQRLARQVPAAEHIMRYAARLILATHPNDPSAPASVRQHLLYGASPRGIQSLILAGKISALLDGRVAVGAEDLREIAMPALRHRLILNFEAQAEGISPDNVIQQVLGSVQVGG
jgi:MoxR-like ATPase